MGHVEAADDHDDGRFPVTPAVMSHGGGDHHPAHDGQSAPAFVCVYGSDQVREWRERVELREVTGRFANNHMGHCNHGPFLHEAQIMGWAVRYVSVRWCNI